jgi:hypothetical protein
MDTTIFGQPAEVLSRQRHGALNLKRGTFLFLNDRPVVPLSTVEAPRAALDLPIAFRRDEHGDLGLVAVLSLNKDDNVHVGPMGMWLGGYVPAVIRTYPFALAFSGEAATVVVATGSDWISTAEGEPLFDLEGNPTETLNSTTDLLRRAFPNPHRDGPMISAIDKQGLIEPWPGASAGLFKVDPGKLARLSDQIFLELRRSGALAMIFAHLMSLPRIERLNQLAQQKGKIRERLIQQKRLPDGDFGLRVEDDMICFD